MPQNESESISELKGFIENYEFPCVGAWDGFNFFKSKLEDFINLSTGFFSVYNKSFLNLTAGAPGSTHDARFLRNSGLFKKATAGEEPPNKTLSCEMIMQK